MSVDLSALHPVLAERLLHAQEEYARRFAPEVLVLVSGLRSDAQQIALYAQGRLLIEKVQALRAAAGMAPIRPAENAHRVTEKDGVRNRSRHQGVLYQGRMVSRAVDVAPAFDPDGPGPGKPVIDWNDLGRFRRLGAIAEMVGLVWGGTWRTFPDPPHLELGEDVA